MARPRWIETPDREALDAQLTERVALALQQAIDERGAATLVVSGGSTPKGFFGLLSQRKIDWSRVTVTLADERCVGPDHADSNERLVREILLRGAAARASFVSLLPPTAPEGHLHEAEVEVTGRLAALGRFDVTILGMGGDGHFASLFPGSAALATGLDLHSGRLCLTVNPPAASHQRMSMTLPRILDTQLLVLHLTGDDKRAVLEQARRDKDPRVLPIAAVLAADHPGFEIFWAP